MNTSNIWYAIGRHLVIAAAMTMSGGCWGVAVAATVHSGSTDTIAAWYGRAGGLTTADEVSEPEALNKSGPPVQVSYSAELAKWTNMPRDQAHEGPVTNTFDATASELSEHWYGRAGGLTGSDTVAGNKTSEHGG